MFSTSNAGKVFYFERYVQATGSEDIRKKFFNWSAIHSYLGDFREVCLQNTKLKKRETEIFIGIARQPKKLAFECCDTCQRPQSACFVSRKMSYDEKKKVLK